MKNPYAVALGKLGAGIKKTLTEEEIKIRTERIKKAQSKRAEMLRKKKEDNKNEMFRM